MTRVRRDVNEPVRSAIHILPGYPVQVSPYTDPEYSPFLLSNLRELVSQFHIHNRTRLGLGLVPVSFRIQPARVSLISTVRVLSQLDLSLEASQCILSL